MPASTFDIRSTFLEFFRSREHKVISSSSLIPAADPTLMFTNAGMVQFKDVFVGRRTAPAPRAATVQKCIRISGKHNDLANVGRTSRHHTFFEMLGNFSFGDYFKERACGLAWELLTAELGLAEERLWVSVFAGDETAPADDEAAAIWSDRIGVPQERILRGTAKDNFWAMGDMGPCGPCSEIMYDRGEPFGEPSLDNGERFFELWNLVFMQYHVDEPGAEMQPLPAPCVDTGAGLERIAAVLQGVDSNYDIDVFKPLVEAAGEMAGKAYGGDPTSDVSMRVIADHARMTALLVAEGVFPDKTGREYVLRRVMRRAIRHGHKLGIDDLFLHEVADRVIDQLGEIYPELVEHRDLIVRVCRQEEARFRATLTRGLDLLRENDEWERSPDGRKVLPGELAFDLSATYGFPKDLIAVIGEEEGFAVDEQGFEDAEAKHRAVSGVGKIGEAAVLPVYSELNASLGDTRFIGYESEAGSTQVLAVIADDATVEQAAEGAEVEVVLADTPFYGESGGQVGDSGTIRGKDGEVEVVETIRPLPGLWVHRGLVRSGRVRPGDEVEVKIDPARRSAIRRHHTATHLLHASLRALLGPHAVQKGSRVAPEGFRFDYAHFEPLSPEQITALERSVASRVVENHEVLTTDTTYEEARAGGATAIFEENYGDVVRLVTIPDVSAELCGGTHVSRTGEIGPFFILGESGIASGVRRIEAVAGLAAVDWAADRNALVNRIAYALKTSPTEIVDKLEKLVTRDKELIREVERLKRELASGGGDILDRVQRVGEIKVLGARIGIGDPAALRDTADTLRQRLSSGVVCLGGDHNGKAAIIVAVTDDLTDRLDANQLVRRVAEIVGGRGGGRRDMAQAGGPDVSKLDDAVGAIFDAVADASQ
jgi:alanyl-tRNA synthetase